MPRISVVIPTKNRPALLERCLASIFREAGTCSEVETIVVDDGSEERSAENNRILCRRYNAAFIRSEANHGMAVARNLGISAARGEWIVFIDDDAAVDQGWYPQLCNILSSLADDEAGFEGRINASGDGVWDREVGNTKGGAYLTCHLGLRRSVLDKCGKFDPQFELKGPYCEDHELAARVLQWGKIPFFFSLSVTHAPRRVDLLKYLLDASGRCRRLLLAEHYFYSKHPDRYHLFRRHRTFWGTLCSMLFRHLINELRRRSAGRLLRHPLQTAALLAGSIIEQFTAWTLIPVLIGIQIRHRSTFLSSVDVSRTASCWHIPESDIKKLRVGRNLLLSPMFSLIRRPPYNAASSLKRLRHGFSGGQGGGIYLRIDDVFLDNEDSVRMLCETMKKRGCPFLAAVKGDDLCNGDRRRCIDIIRDANGTIGIHGFTHIGRFGPYHSELLQMPYPAILEKIGAIRQTGIFEEDDPLILVPPFNAIGPGQIVSLSRLFRVICGGPETMRFTDRMLGPIAIKDGGWYFPSLHPFYGSAKRILKSGASRILPRIYGPVCITVHLDCELSDSFCSLDRLIMALPSRPQSWNRLF